MSIRSTKLSGSDAVRPATRTESPADARIELDPQTGAPSRVVWPDGWSSSSEWLDRLESLPEQLPALREMPPGERVNAEVPRWVRSAVSLPTISAAPSRLLGPDEASLNACERQLLEGRPAVEHKTYAELVKMVALETGCADTRDAVARLLEAAPSPLWNSMSATGLSLLDELYDLAMVVRMRSGAQSIDQPRLLREVIQEIQDPRLMAQHATPSCLMTSIFQFGILQHNRSAEYVRQVRDLAARGTVLLPSGVRFEASENWLEAGQDYRTQSLKLVASAYYSRTHLANPDRVVAESLVYKSVNESVLFEWFLGQPMRLVPVRQGEAPLSRLPEDVPPYVVSLTYNSASSRHAVTVLRANDETVEFLNPWGRVEMATTANFLAQLWRVSRPAQSQVKPGKAVFLEHSTRKGGVIDWTSLSMHEQADALLAYGSSTAHDLAEVVGLSPDETDAMSDFRCALAVVEQSQRSGSTALAAELARLPRLVYREWSSNTDALTTRKRGLVGWHEATRQLDALRERPPPSAQELYRFVQLLLSKAVYFWRPLLRGDLEGAETPIFKKVPDLAGTRVDGMFTELLEWLEKERLLGPICRMETPQLQRFAQEDLRHDRLWGRPIDEGRDVVADFKRFHHRDHPKLSKFMESYAPATQVS